MKNLKLVILVCVFLLISWTIVTANTHTVIVAPGGDIIFSPKDLTIDAGDTVLWVWDSDNHTTTSDATSGPDSWDSGLRNTGATFLRVFNNAGEFPYYCTPHKEFGMVGSITVQAVSAINDENTVLSRSFELEQNYPNPFNPTTKITYSVGTSHGSPLHVELSIYNQAGQKVATLVSENQQAGTYNVQWDATNFASGVYFYKLETSTGFKQSRKLVLVR